MTAKLVLSPVTGNNNPMSDTPLKTESVAALSAEKPAAPSSFESAGKLALFNGVRTEFKSIPADLCDRGQYQPRKSFEEEALRELADSIKQTGGNFDPVILRLKHDGRYEIIAGERRVRATMLAGLNNVNAMLGRFSDEQAMLLALIENIQRKDLNPIEEAEGYQRMALEAGLKHEEVAVATGKSRAHISNSMRLLKTDMVVRDYLRSGKLSHGMGRTLAGLDELPMQRQLAKEVVSKGLSVRQLEAMVAKLKGKPKIEVAPNKNANLRKLEQSVSESLGFPASVQQSTSGKISLTIHCVDNKDFDNMLARIGADVDI